jgi:sRNA-binding carbon storage regulator CsrA
MLVLSRKKSEAILIDGVIRIEVVNLIKAMVRVRLLAPRGLQLPRSAARKEIRDPHDSLARTNAAAMDVFHMTLVNQQILPLRECLNLGVVDVDKSRALFFVDAPLGTSVMAAEPDAQDRAGASPSQILLQFMAQGAERPEQQREKSAPGGSRVGQTSIEGSSAEPDVLPFPSNQLDRHS